MHTENGDSYENTLAERMNHTLKEEYSLYKVLKKQKSKPKHYSNKPLNFITPNDRTYLHKWEHMTWFTKSKNPGT